jgi:hypothetical protein
MQPLRGKAALGFRAHSGWAALVVVAGSPLDPKVLERRKVEIAPRAPGSLQPYHAAQKMEIADAESFIERCRAATRQLAETAVRDVVATMAGQGYTVTGACVLLGSGRPMTNLAATLRSHPMIHTAEGDFFREALSTACESCALPVIGVKEKELINHATSALGITADTLQLRISALGKAIGPPWREDQKLCAIAAWVALTRCGAAH